MANSNYPLTTGTAVRGFPLQGWCDYCERSGHVTDACTVTDQDEWDRRYGGADGPLTDADGYAGFETDGPFDAWMARP